MTWIASDRILGSDGTFFPGRLLVQDGRIAAIDPLESPLNDGRILAPAFVDLQVNGIDDVDVWSAASRGDHDAWDRLDSMLIERGVGAWCPTLVSAPLERYGDALTFMAKRRGRIGAPRAIGPHLEGPFLGEARGAHRAECVIDADTNLLASWPEPPALFTVGAENPGIIEIIERCRHEGTVVSIGHSRPTRDQYERAVSAGASMVTHLFNAMSGLAHRDPGLAAWVLSDDRMIAGLIADGVHVHPDLIRLAFRCKPGAIALVTDSVAWRANRAGPVMMSLVDGVPRLADGTLAGSAASMTDCLRVCVGAGVPLGDTLLAATKVPARALGLLDAGRIEVGCRADLVELDADLNVLNLHLAGRLVSRA